MVTLCVSKATLKRPYLSNYVIFLQTWVVTSWSTINHLVAATSREGILKITLEECGEIAKRLKKGVL